MAVDRDRTHLEAGQLFTGKTGRYGKWVWGPVLISALLGALIFFGTGSPVAIWVGGIMVSASYFFFSGFADYRRYMLMRDTPTSTARGAATGPVEVKGEVTETGGLLASPFSGQDCVAYRFEVEEFRQQGKHSSWVTIDKGEAAVPFDISDQTGSIRVEPEGAELNIPRDNRFKVRGGKEPPQHIQRFIERNPDVDSEDRSIDLRLFKIPTGNDRRYSEWFIAPGDTVYVFGSAMPADDGRDGELIINRDENSPMFMISDRSERSLRNNMLLFIAAKLIAGIIGGLIAATTIFGPSLSGLI